jgi:hypothetical protein
MPPELEWFVNIANDQTRRAYKNDVKEFSGFVGIESPVNFASSRGRANNRRASVILINNSPE